MIILLTLLRAGQKSGDGGGLGLLVLVVKRARLRNHHWRDSHSGGSGAGAAPLRLGGLLAVGVVLGAVLGRGALLFRDTFNGKKSTAQSVT